MDELIKKIEGGSGLFPKDFPKCFTGIPWAIRAYEGSLDAALNFYNVKEISNSWSVSYYDSVWTAEIRIRHNKMISETDEHSPSRAFLLSILKLIQYKEEWYGRS